MESNLSQPPPGGPGNGSGDSSGENGSSSGPFDPEHPLTLYLIYFLLPFWLFGLFTCKYLYNLPVTFVVP